MSKKDFAAVEQLKDSSSPHVRFWAQVQDILLNFSSDPQTRDSILEGVRGDSRNNNPAFFQEITPKKWIKRLSTLREEYFRCYLRPQVFGDFIFNGGAILGVYIDFLFNPQQDTTRGQDPEIQASMKIFGEISFDWIFFTLDEGIRFLLRKEKGSSVLPLHKFRSMVSSLASISLAFAPGETVTRSNEDVDLNFKGMFYYLVSLFCVLLPDKHPRLRLRQDFFQLGSASLEGREVVLNLLALLFSVGMKLLLYPKRCVFQYVIQTAPLLLDMKNFIRYFYTQRDVFSITISVPEYLHTALHERLNQEIISIMEVQRAGQNIQTLHDLSRQEWNILLEKHRRGIRPGGVDRVEFDALTARILRMSRFKFVQEGYMFPEVGLVGEGEFFGWRKEMRGRVSAEGGLCFATRFPVDALFDELFRFAVLRAYRNFVVGGHRAYDDELREIEHSVVSGSGRSYRTIIPCYLRRLPEGFRNSDETYVVALVAGYSREFLDGANERHSPLNFVPAYEFPKDSHLPLYLPPQRFSFQEILTSLSDLNLPEEDDALL